MSSRSFPTGPRALLLAGLLSASPALAHVTLNTPNGGEQLQVGSQVQIEWTILIMHGQLNWDLWYSNSGPNGPWIPMAMDLPPGATNAGSKHQYMWTVPDDVSNKVRVRVRMDNAGQDYEDISNSNLAIVPALGGNYCGPAVPNSTGSSAVIHAWGSDVVADQEFNLTATQLPTMEFGYFLNAPAQAFVQNPGGSQGNLCLGGGVGRHVSQLGNSGDAGQLVITVDLSQLPRPNGMVVVQAGETWNFTCWFRDKNPGTTSNFTDGVAVTFN
jgi:hypothetical protein